MEEYVLGVKINTGYTLESAVDEAISLLEKPGSHYISTTNAEFVIKAQEDPEFKKIINEADLSMPDGVGVLYALYYDKLVKKLKSKYFLFNIQAFFTGITFGISSLYKNYPLGQRIAGVEMVDRFCEYASRNDKTVFLLGGSYKDMWGNMVEKDEDMATSVARVLKEKYPGLRIVGATSFFKSDVSDDLCTLDYIHKCMKDHGLGSIDFLFVAYNHPKQEKWIYRNKDKIPAKVCMGVGGTFDYISGSKKRAPEVFCTMNLEWLYKLITQPWRIKRIIKAFPIFPYLVYINTLKRS